MLSHRQRLAGTAIFSLTLAFLAADKSALADCSAVGDVVTCDNVGAENSPFNAGAGDQTIDIVSGTYANAINGNAGLDTFNASGGQVGALNGDADNDILNLTGTSVTGNVNGGLGDDTINASAGTVNGDLTGGDGNDSFSIGGTFSVAGDVLGGDGADFFTITGGTIGSEVLGGLGDDTVTLSGGTIGDDIEGEDGNDTLVVTSGSVLDDLRGGAGNDLIGLLDGTVGDDILGGDGDDSIVVAGGSLGGDILGGADNDTIFTAGGTVGGSVFGDAGDDSVLLLGGTVAGSAEGGIGDDTVAVSGASLGGSVLGGDGNDVVGIGGGSVGGNIEGNDGDDSVVLSGGVVSGSLLGGLGEDDMLVSSGSVTGDVDGGDDDDEFSVSGGTVGGSLLGGLGEDDFEMTGGTVAGSLGGGFGDDLILIEGGSIAGNVEGNEDEDIIIISGGSIGGNVDGGTSGDLIGIGGTATVTGDILTGSGAVNAVLIGNPLDGTGSASIGGDILGGSGVDIVGLVNVGSFTGTVDTGANTDVIYVLGGESIIDPSITGDFNEQLTTVAALVGGDGNDYLVLDNVGDPISPGVGDIALPATVSGIENIAVVNDSYINLFNPASDTRDLSEVQQFLVWDSAIQASGNSPGTTIIGGNLAAVDGIISLQDDEANDLVQIGGDYAGAGSSLIVMDAALDGSEASDRIEIGGSVTDVTLNIPELGLSTVVANTTTEIGINDIGNGIGAWTGKGPTDGLLLIDVAGTTSATDFVLAGGPIQVGVFDYDLSLEGNNWYLQSDLLDQGFAYGAIPAAMLAVQNLAMGSLYERVGDPRQIIGGAQLNDPDESLTGLGGYSGAWVRGLGAWSTHDGNLQVGSSEVATSFEQDTALVQVGADFDVTTPFGLDPATDGALVLGISGIYGQTWVHADDDMGDKVSDWDSDVYGAQFTGTWYMPNGIYADLGAQVLWYNGDVSTVAEGHKADVDGFGYGFGAEVGYQIPVTRHLQLVPNGRLNYQNVTFDDFTDNDGVDVELHDGQSLEGRIGLVLDAAMRPGRGAWFTGYLEGNIVHEFLGDASVEASGTELGYDMKQTAAEIGIGASVRVIESVSAYAQVDYQIPFDSDEGTKTLQATGGLRLNF